jgi:nucleoside-diphosphate-sugar epimerase
MLAAMPRVLLTGGAGFIGSHLARLLISQGCEVTVVVRPGSDRRRIENLSGPLRVLEENLDEPSRATETARQARPDLCIHLAWYTASADCLDSDKNLACISASLSLLRGLEEVGCRAMVFAGTGTAYDAERGRVTEGTSDRPRTLYAASKCAFALAAREFLERRGGSFAEARIFQVYGPGEIGDRLVPYLIRRLLGGQECVLSAGNQVRDYLHVEDVASAIWTIAHRGTSGKVNIGSSHPLAVSDIARRIGAILDGGDRLRFGQKPLKEGEPAVLYPANDLLRSFGWSPRYELDNGLRQTVAWWRSRLEGAL